MRDFYTALSQPVFNGYDVLIWILFVESILFALFYLLHSRALIPLHAEARGESQAQIRLRQHSARVLAGFVLLVGLTELVFLLTYNPVLSRWIEAQMGSWAFSALALIFFFPGALLFHYVKSLIYRGSTRDTLLLLPPTAFILSVLVEPLGLFGQGLQPLFWRPHIFIATVAFGLNTLFALLTLWHLYHYRQQIQHYYGDLDAVNPRWLMVVTSGFALIWAMALVPPFLPLTGWPVLRHTIIHFPSVLEMFLLTAAIVFGLSQGMRIVGITAVRPKVDDEPEQEVPFSDALLGRLTELMESEHWYRRTDATVEQFAEAAGHPVRMVSQAINRHFEKNFYEFVNHYRIEEIKQRLRREDPDKVSIQKIYETAGFRSKSSFNTIFKKRMGMTPSEYRREFGPKRGQIPAAQS